MQPFHTCKPLIEGIQQQTLISKIQVRNSYRGEEASVRYQKFLALQPDIALRVPLADIASYLGVTPQSAQPHTAHHAITCCIVEHEHHIMRYCINFGLNDPTQIIMELFSFPVTPFQIELCFHSAIERLEHKAAASPNTEKGIHARELLKEIEPYPELRNGLTSVEAGSYA